MSHTPLIRRENGAKATILNHADPQKLRDALAIIKPTTTAAVYEQLVEFSKALAPELMNSSALGNITP